MSKRYHHRYGQPALWAAFVAAHVRLVTISALTVLSIHAGGSWAAETVVLHGEHLSYNLVEYLEILEDREGNWTIEDVSRSPLSGQFAPLVDRVLNMGITSSAYWLRFTVVKGDFSRVPEAFHRDWIVHIDWPFLSPVRFYLPKKPDEVQPGEEKWTEVIRGISVDTNLGTAATVPPPRLLLFRLPDDLPEPRTMYLRVQSDVTLFLPIRLCADINYLDRSNKRKILLGIFYGVILTLALVNLIQSFSLSDKSYLYHALYVIFIGLFFAALNGLFHEYILPYRNELIERLTGIFLGMVVISCSLFTKNFLLTKRHTPFFDRIITLMIVLAGIMVISSMFVPLQPFVRASVILGFLGPAAIIGVGVVCMIRGFHPAKYYLFAWSFFCIGAVIHTLNLMGILPLMNAGIYCFQASVALEVVLLQFALFDRMTTLYREREEARRGERRYMQLAITDGLTGLFNARYFRTQFPIEVQRSETMEIPLSMLMLDVDDFKTYNDRYGHPEGDRVLSHLGKVIMASIRENDPACRYGGEEFAVILSGSTGAGAVVIAERIRSLFEQQKFALKNDEFGRSTVSIGIAEHVVGEGASVLLDRADQALYLAKRRGKNRIMFAK